MSLGAHMTRVHLSISKALRAVLDEVGRQDHRSLSNLIEHGMREWVANEISFERYQQLETGPIRRPGAYRPDPDATQQNVSALNPPKAFPRKNQYKDGTYLATAEGRKYAAIGQRIRDAEAQKSAQKPKQNEGK